jgi:biopolymer transport protein ExbD
MNIRPKAREQARFHTDALNDILFILLFFFLIVAILANPNVIKVNNPKAQSDTQVKQSIAVSIDASQNFYIGQERVEYEQIASIVSSKIAQEQATNPTEFSIVINADREANAEQIVAIMRIAQRLKVRSVLAVEKTAE